MVAFWSLDDAKEAVRKFRDNGYVAELLDDVRISAQVYITVSIIAAGKAADMLDDVDALAKPLKGLARINTGSSEPRSFKTMRTVGTKMYFCGGKNSAPGVGIIVAIGSDVIDYIELQETNITLKRKRKPKKKLGGDQHSSGGCDNITGSK